MFMLFDSFYPSYLNYLPSLGCASLLSVCKTANIDTFYYQTQKMMSSFLFEENIEVLLSIILNANTELPPEFIDKSPNEVIDLIERAKLIYNRLFQKNSIKTYFDYREIALYGKVTDALHKIIVSTINKSDETDLPFINTIVSETLDKNPSLIGFSTIFEFDPISREIRRRIKQNSGIPIVLGGCITPFLTHDNYAAIFEQEHVDYIVIGQAEHILKDIYESAISQTEPKDIPGVFYCSNNEIRGTKPALIKDLNTLPIPDFSQFDLDQYFSPCRVLPVSATRGCSWRKCSFCSHEAFSQGKYQTYSIDKVIETLTDYKQRYKTNHFFFNDAELSPRLVERISERIIENPHLKGNISISFLARLEKGFLKPGLLDKIYNAGFVSIIWGLESGSQEVLASMQKGTTVEISESVLKKAHEASINNGAFLIFGFPGELSKHRQETFEFIYKLKDSIFFCIPQEFNLVQGSPIYENPEKWNIVRKDNRWVYKNGEMASDTFDSTFKEITRSWATGHLDGTLSTYLGSHKYFHSVRVIALLFKSHELVPSKELKGLVEKNQFSNLYPIMPNVYNVPVNINQTYPYQYYKFDHPFFFDSFASNRNALLSFMETLCVYYADGTHTVEEISSKVKTALTSKTGIESIHAKANDFFKEKFYNHQALAFKKPWISL